MIERGYDWGKGGIVGFYDVENSRWSGARFRCAGGAKLHGVTIAVSSSAVGPARGITVADVVVDGWRGENAFAIDGDDVTLINPITVNPDPDTSNGIRVTGGTGFRCHGGSIETGGDAALQFASSPGGRPISDGAYLGTRAKTNGGRVLLVGTSYDTIEDVRFVGITGETTYGELIGVLRGDPRGDGDGDGGDGGGTAMAVADGGAWIARVLFQDVALMRTGDPPQGEMPRDGMILSDMLHAPGQITGIAFDTVSVDVRNDCSAVRISAEQPHDGESYPLPITGVRWRCGRVAAAASTKPLLRLSHLTDATFDMLRLEANTTAAAVSIGPDVACENVVFADSWLTGLATGQIALRLGLATGCGWRRGAMAGETSPPIDAVAAWMTANAQRCFVEGANLDAIRGTVTIDPAAADVRLRDNYGGAQQTFVSLGEALAVPAAATVSVVSSFAALGAGGPVQTVAAGAEGDLLVLSGAGTTVADTTGSDGNLRLSAADTLDGDDTLTLLRRPGTIRAELARADNG